MEETGEGASARDLLPSNHQQASFTSDRSFVAPCRRRSRLDRSPSVEIIYEGTATAAQPPARKRRRKQQRGMQIR